MRGPLDVHRLLLAADVAHEMVHLPRLVGSADELPDVLGLPASACVAVRFRRRSGGGLIAAAVPAGTEPATEALLGALAAAGAVLSARDPQPAPGGAGREDRSAWPGSQGSRSTGRPGAPGGPALRRASATAISAATDYPALLACPVGLPPEMPLLVADTLLDAEVLYCAAGDGATALGVRGRDLVAVTSAVAVPVAAAPAPAGAPGR